MQELLGHASTRNGLLSILKNSRERAPTCNFTILWYPELLTAGRVTFAQSLWKKLFNYLTEGRLSVKLKRIFKTLCYIGDHIKENYAVGLLEEYIEYELFDGILLRNSFKKFPEIVRVIFEYYIEEISYNIIIVMLVL